MSLRLISFLTVCQLTVVGSAASPRVATKSLSSLHEERAARRPIDLAYRDGQLIVANRRGTLTVIDLRRRAVLRETRVATRLERLRMLRDGKRWAAVDSQRNELIVGCLRTDGKATVSARLQVSATPVNLLVSADERRVYVAGMWSRRITICRLGDSPAVIRQLDLPLPPRELLLTPDQKTLIAADAFGGRLALIDLPGWSVRRTLPLAGHQLRRMTWSRDQQAILIPHQLLRAERGTTHDGVHWGGVLSNVIRRLPLQSVLDPKARRIGITGLFYLGHPGRAFGDPFQLKETKDRRHVVSFAGVDEVGLSDVGANYYKPIRVGARPTALVLDAAERFAYVANTLEDSVSQIDLKAEREAARISLGPRREPTFAERGERAFYNARLAVDGWYSCNSCHVDGHSNGQRNDNLSDDSFGAPKRVLSLGGTLQTAPWAWDGEAQILEEQIRSSVVHTMRGKEPPVEQVQALAAFLATLRPAPSVDRLRGTMNRKAVQRGRQVFQSRGCATCHEPPTYSSAAAYDVGLPDENGRREFNPPSLRGVSQRDRLFHDNRATSLRDVLVRFKHNLKRPLSDADRKDLIAFLRSL